MYEIFKKELDRIGKRPANITKETGIPASTFSDWKKGKSRPSTDKMIKIAKFLNVSVEYLTTGKEPESKLYSAENAELMVEITRNLSNDNFERLLRHYTELNEKDKNTVNDLVEFLHNKNKEEES